MTSKTIRWTAAAAAFGLVCAVNAQGKLTSVSTKKVGAGAEISIKGDDLGQPKTIRVNGSHIYILEFNAGLGSHSGKQTLGYGGVNSVSYGWFSAKPEKVRVSLNLAPNQEPVVKQTPDGWVVDVNVDGSAQKLATKLGDAFPNSVPAIPKAKASNSATLMAMSGPTTPGAGAPRTPYTGARVSLDFVNTDVVQILKALALQANVNVITAPEINGKITITLDGVTVPEALDFVTTLVGARYAKVGSTYVVMPANRMPDIRIMQGRGDEASETRVLAINSGEGAQIKAAVLQSIPQERQDGKYSLILATEQINIDTKAKPAGAPAAGGAAPAAGGGTTGGGGAAAGDQQSDITTKTAAPTAGGKQKDVYVILVGTPSRLDEVERLVKSVDDKIAMATNLGANNDIVTRVVPIYSSQMAKIKENLQAMVDRDPKSAAFRVSDTGTSGQTDEAVNFLLISGPAGSVQQLEEAARTLDKGICDATGVSIPSNAEEARRNYELVDINYVEPLLAATELQEKIRGLKATILLGAVDPLIYGPKDTPAPGVVGHQPSSGVRTVTSERGGGTASSNSTTQQQTGGSSTGATGQGGAAAPGGTTSQAGANGTNQSSASNNGGVTDTMSKTIGTEPMKLMLNGTKAQIAEGKRYLAMIDLAPRQVAVELRVMELNQNDALKAGLDWSVLTGGSLQLLHLNQASGNDSTPGGIQAKTGWKGGGAATVLGQLDRLTTNNNLIARPNILASDGRPSNVFVGDEIRYIQSIQSTQQGVTVTTGQVDVGVDFTVIPRISSDGNISIDMRPTLTILQSFTPVPGGGQLPQTSKRTAQTIVNMRSGETIAIGGLIQNQDQKSFGGIPFLRDIPILGRIFGRTNNTRVRQEVVFFVTVKEVTPATRGAAANPKDAEKSNTEWPGNPIKKGGN